MRLTVVKSQIIRLISAVENVREQYGFQIGIMLVSSGFLWNCTRVTPYIYSSDLALPDKKSDFPMIFRRSTNMNRVLIGRHIWYDLYNINHVVWLMMHESCIITGNNQKMKWPKIENLRPNQDRSPWIPIWSISVYSSATTPCLWKN